VAALKRAFQGHRTPTLRRYLSDHSMAQLKPISDTDTIAAIDSGA
jgi:hypothetical protein